MAQQFPTSQGVLGDFVDWRQHREALPSCAIPMQAQQHLSLASLMQAQGSGARPTAPGITMQELMQLALVNGSAGSPSAAHGQAFAGMQRQSGCDLALPFHVGTSFAAAAHHQSAMAPMPNIQDSPGFLAHLATSQGPASAHSVPSKREDPSESDAEQSDAEREARGSVNTIFPRRKQGQHARINSQPVILNEATLSQLFTLPLHKAAVKLGISATAMKSACRKLGIKKWPYRALSGNSTKLQRKPRTCSPSGASTRRSSGKAPQPSSHSESSTYHSSDLSKDAQLLAETMRLLQQGVQGEGQPCKEQAEDGQRSASSSDSDCDSEVSGASTREGGQQEQSQRESSPQALGALEQSSPGSSASTTTAQPNSVASLLN